MIKRSYFVRAKIPHNNNTGLYSWWSGVMVLESWLERDGAYIFNQAMALAHHKISQQMEQSTRVEQVEIESLNRL